ncbi:hypothetical protein GCM10020221_08690 [Streptomyces thioluteus]|uniref:Uncharacterized protein n=1 Tax=Streptomyces thioluteus TaxID=66431 RepID=A0ABN3WGG1_STRTU
MRGAGTAGAVGLGLGVAMVAAVRCDRAGSATAKALVEAAFSTTARAVLALGTCAGSLYERDPRRGTVPQKTTGSGGAGPFAVSPHRWGKPARRWSEIAHSRRAWARFDIRRAPNLPRLASHSVDIVRGTSP